jgi:2,5-diketo-D-gluconate reductase A
MRTRTLTAGVEIPYLGFGTYLINDGEAAAAVSAAVRAGYRHIDTAEGYQNESGVGAGIRQALESEGLARSDLFVTTKLWPGNPAWGQPAKTTESTVASLDESLERLGLDYVDLYLIHVPFEREQRLAQWRGLVESQQQGKARAIGVSNFSPRRRPIRSSFIHGRRSLSWSATSRTTRSSPSPTAAWCRSPPGAPPTGMTARSRTR